jgi:hypothetical protein
MTLTLRTAIALPVWRGALSSRRDTWEQGLCCFSSVPPPYESVILYNYEKARSMPSTMYGQVR